MGCIVHELCLLSVAVAHSEKKIIHGCFHTCEIRIVERQRLIVRDLIRPERNPAVTIDVEMETVLERSMHQNFIPVTDDRGSFIGIVTRQDIIRRFCGNERKPNAAVSRVYPS